MNGAKPRSSTGDVESLSLLRYVAFFVLLMRLKVTVHGSVTLALVTAAGDTGANSCVQQSLGEIKRGWATVETALGALTSVAGGECKTALESARTVVPVVSGNVTAPTTLADAEQLPTEISNELDGFVQQIQQAKTVCAG